MCVCGLASLKAISPQIELLIVISLLFFFLPMPPSSNTTDADTVYYLFWWCCCYYCWYFFSLLIFHQLLRFECEKTFVSHTHTHSLVNAHIYAQQHQTEDSLKIQKRNGNHITSTSWSSFSFRFILKYFIDGSDWILCHLYSISQVVHKSFSAPENRCNPICIHLISTTQWRLLVYVFKRGFWFFSLFICFLQIVVFQTVFTSLKFAIIKTKEKKKTKQIKWINIWPKRTWIS